jgi:membrane protein YqaA with SNARE-associated domain
VNQLVIVLSVAISVWLQSYWLLLLPISANLSGILFQSNFVINIAKYFLKQKPSEYLQEDKSDLRFNQLIATSLLLASLLAWLLGQGILATVLAALVFTAASIALTGFCVGCWLRFQLKQWQYRRHTKKS